MSVIKRKQHFADRKLNSVTVPEDTVSIGEWAYAFCGGLREIRIPVGCEVADKAFQGSEELARIFLYEKSGEGVHDVNGAPELLALAVLAWPEHTRSAIAEAAEDEGFLSRFDSKMKTYLSEDDADAYSPFLAGGEEDYADEGEEKERFIFSVRLKKAKMIFERLLCAGGPDEETKAAYLKWLGLHNPEIPFALIRSAGERRPDYERLYFQCRLQEAADAETLLRCADDDVELRSAILRHTGENSGGDILNGLRL
ncbi:MAG: leucine-rich repeat domain-containing protein [Lachnospiraceae bacterium]|nr:leucine-rich repeat domain-containing protein [Lachnospiraceae bacterium]